MSYEFEEISKVKDGDTFREYIFKSGLCFFTTIDSEIMTDCGFRKLGHLAVGDKVVVDRGYE